MLERLSAIDNRHFSVGAAFVRGRTSKISLSIRFEITTLLLLFDQISFFNFLALPSAINSYQSMAANPPPDLQESSATASNPNQFLAGRTGDALVPDLELAIQRRTDMSNGFLNSEGDPNAPRQAHNWWLSGEFAGREGAFLFVSIVLAIVSGAAGLIYLAIKHPGPVLKIMASLFTGAVFVTLFLLLVGWTRGYGKMVRIGVLLARLEFYLWLILTLVAMKCIGKL
ncbi:uncharacterized protein LOC115669680 [Syzygium oleosum]|uniref:uncharacterized protein LOC115669680 n=1 Tax=Syzygium oleosum TaxID=219896 RepID=UPI0024BB1169|nr:uncharacterized protein LOC115669680 [Syzygium oleosum]